MSDPRNPGWKPRTMSMAGLLFGIVRAVSGEWAVNGEVKRLHFRKGAGRFWHLIIGPWCLTVGRERA